MMGWKKKRLQSLVHHLLNNERERKKEREREREREMGSLSPNEWNQVEK